MDFGFNLTPWPPLLGGEGETFTRIYHLLLPFSFQEKGLGDEFLDPQLNHFFNRY
jgi:hypothetical protein